MNSFALRFWVLACIAALCLTVGCRNQPSQSKDGFNLFDRNRPAPRREVTPPPSQNDLTRRISEGLRQSVDPEKRGTGRAALYYGAFLVGVAVVVAGLVYWKVWKRRRVEWELNDPMALVQDLNFVHQLSEQEKRLMQEVSRKNSFPSSLRLFVEPKFLLEAWEDDAFASSQPLVRRLLSKLFNITMEGGGISTVVIDGTETVLYVQASSTAAGS